MAGENLPKAELTRARRSMGAESVLDALREIHAGLAAGELFPSQRDLVRRLDASERSVMWALAELKQEGKIVRRHGKGTFVAPDGSNGASSGGAQTGTIVALLNWQDGGYIEHCVTTLFPYVRAAGLTLTTQMVQGTNADVAALTATNPLGFLIFSGALAPLGVQLLAADHRVVQIGLPASQGAANLPCVYSDREHGTYLAMRHLLELGHRRIALSGNDPPPGVRWRGCWRAIQELEEAAEDVQWNFLDGAVLLKSWTEDPTVAREFFAAAEAPTGLVMWNDIEALKLIGTLSRAGVRVPEDVSVVGYDNLPVGQLGHPALTTIDAGLGQQASAALGILLTPEPFSSSNLLVAPTLVVRDSSGPAPE